MTSRVSFGNGHILKSLSFVNQSLPGSGIFTTPFVDVSDFSSFNVVATNSSANLDVTLRYSLNTIFTPETCFEETTNFLASPDLTDLGSFLVKTRYLAVHLVGTPGHNFCLQLVFREGPTFNGLLENVGPYAQVYVEGTPGDFRTLQSSDASLTITQNADNIDIVGSASTVSKWNEVGNILYPKNNNVSIIAGGGSTNSVANGINNGILAGNGNIIPSQGQYCIIAGGGDNTFSGNGAKIYCAIVGGNLNSITGGVNAYYNSIIGGQSNVLDTTSASGNDYIRWSNIMSSSGCSMTTTTGTTDYCNIIGGVGNLIRNCTRSSITSSNASSITGGGNAAKTNCVIIGGNINTISGTTQGLHSGIICSNDSNITTGGTNLFSSFILGGNVCNLTSSNSNFWRSGIICGDTCTISSRTVQSSIISANNSSMTGTGLKSACVISGNNHSITGTGSFTSCNILGGDTNTISGSSTLVRNTIIGGVNNTISSSAGNCTDNIILGGNANNVTGVVANCVVGGSNATASNTGCFIFSTGTALATSASNQTTIKSAGGTRVFSNDLATVGVSLAAGGNSWASVCDINQKENLVEIDEEDVLEKLGDIVVYKYNYIGNPVEQICYGTTAQNFHEVFPYPKITVVNETTGLPEEVSSKDPCSIESMDLIGLMLAGLKQLRAENIELRADFEEYKTSSEQRILELETEVDNLTMSVASNQSSITSLNGSISILQGNDTIQNGQISSLNGSISVLQSNDTSHNSQISSLNTSVAANTSNIIKLNNVKLGLSIF
jgi:hypothetical protein